MEEIAMPPRTEDGPQKEPKPLAQGLARNAHEEAAPGPGHLVGILEAVPKGNA
jgi:hypothetical protein